MEILALIVSFLSLIFSLFTYLMMLRHDQRKDTLDAFNVLQEQALDPLQRYTLEQVIKIAENPCSDEYRQISTYLARIEHFCVGVEERIYDHKTVQRLAAGFLNKSVYVKLKPVIEKKNRRGNCYCCFCRVVDKMNKEEENK